MWFRQVLRLQSISRQNFRVQIKYEIHLCPILSASAPARSRKNGYYEILGVSANSRNGDIKVKLVSLELNHNGIMTSVYGFSHRINICNLKTFCYTLPKNKLICQKKCEALGLNGI